MLCESSVIAIISDNHHGSVFGDDWWYLLMKWRFMFHIYLLMLVILVIKSLARDFNSLSASVGS